MKKTRFIALALVVAIALMGAGYAAWTDKLVIDTKVETGKLDVDFIKIEKPDQQGKNKYNDPAEVTVTGDVIKALPGDDADNNGSKDYIEMKISNLYPGAKVRRIVTLENKGSIPVKISENNFKFVGTGNQDVVKAMNVDVDFEVKKGNNHGYSIEGESDIDLQHGCPNPPKKDWVELKVGEKIEIEIEFELDWNRATNEITEEKKDVVYTMTLNFEQFNHPGYQ